MSLNKDIQPGYPTRIPDYAASIPQVGELWCFRMFKGNLCAKIEGLVLECEEYSSSKGTWRIEAFDFQTQQSQVFIWEQSAYFCEKLSE